MPYVNQEIRKDYGPLLGQLVRKLRQEKRCNLPGILNYLTTSMCMRGTGPDKNYADYNMVQGVLKCAGDEIYRRWTAEYEEKKIVENGDILVE